MSAIFDYVIIGSGLSGLSMATRLSQETSRVLLLDTAEVAGGWLRKPHLAALPATPSAEKGLLFVEDLTGIKIAGETLETPAITFEEGQFKTFLGFGEKTPEFYEEIAYYCAHNYIQLKALPPVWINRLLENFKGTFSPRSIVTKFVIENGRVQHLLVNGTKKIQGHNFIYCGDVKSLNRLMPADFISPKIQTKISKTKTWTRVTLQLTHDTVVTDSTAYHVLVGTSQDEVVTCVGQFEGTTSTWMTFVSDEEAEDAEIVGQALKRIKKQIKRAYPDSIGEKTVEKISVQANFGGHFELKLNANQSWPEVENLWVGSSTLSKNRNILGAINQSQLVLAALGFGTDMPVATPESEIDSGATTEAQL